MTDYRLLESQMTALISGETDALANAANVAALLYQNLDDVNWLGFYVLRDRQLVLGPFQGNSACVRIDIGRGVCGAAIETLETQRVDDVHAFPGHIACDAASRSELVVPLIVDGAALGVLDIDSPRLARFTADDQRGIESICRSYLASVDPSNWL